MLVLEICPDGTFNQFWQPEPYEETLLMAKGSTLVRFNGIFYQYEVRREDGWEMLEVRKEQTGVDKLR